MLHVQLPGESQSTSGNVRFGCAANARKLHGKGLGPDLLTESPSPLVEDQEWSRSLQPSTPQKQIGWKGPSLSRQPVFFVATPTGTQKSVGDKVVVNSPQHWASVKKRKGKSDQQRVERRERIYEKRRNRDYAEEKMN